ncbi:hypothetical protein G7051_17630 [Dysgonomonas sp. HDW5B]|uniref:hypothetical protein n=1 Tax=Dysgonomonas sp. HDW5B TaxID=2714927 RepID=UPI0014076437|nr:hypothetical protein [Dysgonomonas sp. HDW5B]QIK56082.1 hypothetical protein G7051_17630 [Dysgonomonas sp. HDW5B]
MAIVLDTNAEFTPKLLLTIEELQFNNNDYLNLYTSHCDKITKLLFDYANLQSDPESKNKIFDMLKYTHEIREILEVLKAPINP